MLSHSAMVAVFLPAFLLLLFAIRIGLRRYCAEVGSAPVTFAHLLAAASSAATKRNPGGGQGQGCDFENEHRFSNAAATHVRQ